jgi:hypothetical protein
MSICKRRISQPLWISNRLGLYIISGSVSGCFTQLYRSNRAWWAPVAEAGSLDNRFTFCDNKVREFIGRHPYLTAPDTIGMPATEKMHDLKKQTEQPLCL